MDCTSLERLRAYIQVHDSYNSYLSGILKSKLHSDCRLSLPMPDHERDFLSLLQKYFLLAFLSEKAHHVLRSTPSAQNETTKHKRHKIMHNFDKNEESKQLKPWSSSLIYSLEFLQLIVRCRHIHSASTAALLKYDE